MERLYNDSEQRAAPGQAGSPGVRRTAATPCMCNQTPGQFIVHRVLDGHLCPARQALAGEGSSAPATQSTMFDDDLDMPAPSAPLPGRSTLNPCDLVFALRLPVLLQWLTACAAACQVHTLQHAKRPFRP